MLADPADFHKCGRHAAATCVSSSSIDNDYYLQLVPHPQSSYMYQVKIL